MGWVRQVRSDHAEPGHFTGRKFMANHLYLCLTIIIKVLFVKFKNKIKLKKKKKKKKKIN